MKGIRLEKKGKRLELDLYGTVGSIWDDGINAAKVVALLRNAEDVTEIECRINSMGGNAFDGIAIMNALKDHPAEVTVKVDGLAASAASIIAMAGDTIEMGEGSFLMVHRASGFVYGQADDMLKTAEILKKADGEIIDVYARRTGKPVETVRAWVDAETWFTGQEAVEAGLADKVVSDPGATAKAVKALASAKGPVLDALHLPERLKNALEAVPAAKPKAAPKAVTAKARRNPFVLSDADEAADKVNPFLPKQGSAPDMSSNPFVPREDDTAIPPAVARFLPKGDDDDGPGNPFLPKGDD